MRREFYDIYRDQYELYLASQYELEYFRVPRVYPERFAIRNLRTVDEAINEALIELGLTRRLRPDARLFLFVNLHQMIALPLAYAQAVQLEVRPVDSMIRDDVRTVLEAAATESKEDEISGHAVLTALNNVWGKLRTVELNVWG